MPSCTTIARLRGRPTTPSCASLPVVPVPSASDAALRRWNSSCRAPCRRPVLAVGGHLKTTVALAWGRRIVVSPHIGDMGTLRSEQVFAQVVADLQRLYDVRAEVVLSDAHPDYATTRWARTSGLEHAQVQHHRAHASALVTEHGRADALAIVFAWDGVGLGDDGTLWGGETFSARRERGGAQRTCGPSTCRAATAPAARRGAVRPPCAGSSIATVPSTCRTRSSAAPGSGASIRRDRVPRAACSTPPRPSSSACGETSFEGQGPMWLEAIARDPVYFPQLQVRPVAEGQLQLDWAPLVDWLLRKPATEPADRAGAVHSSLADGIVQVAERLRAQIRHVARGPDGRGVPESAPDGDRALRTDRARLRSPAAQAAALQRWRTELRPGRRLHRWKRIDCVHALVRTTFPRRPASRVFAGDALHRGRVRRGDADRARSAVPALRARAVLRGAVPVLLVPPRALQRSEDRPLFRGAAPRDPPLPRAGIPLQRRLRRRRHADGQRGRADRHAGTRAFAVAGARGLGRDQPEPPGAGRPAAIPRRGRHAPVGRRAEFRRRPAGRHGPAGEVRQRRSDPRAHRGRAGHLPDAQRRHDLQPAGADAGDARARPRRAAVAAAPTRSRSIR